MYLMPLYLSAICVLGFTTWSNKCSASSLGINQSTASTHATVSDSLRPSLKSDHNERPQLTEPSIPETGSSLYFQQHNADFSYVVPSTLPPGSGNYEETYVETQTEASVSTSEFPAEIEYSTQVANDAESTESITLMSTLEEASTLGFTETTVENSQNMELVHTDIGVTEWTPESADPTESVNPSTVTGTTPQDPNVSEDSHQDTYTTETLDQVTQTTQVNTDVTRTTDLSELEQVTEASSIYETTVTTDQNLLEDKTGISSSEVGATEDATAEIVPEMLLREAADFIEFKYNMTRSAIKERKSQERDWNRMAEMNQIEDDDVKSPSKNSWKDKYRKKRILDDMGFLVSHPEEERLDEEDDLEIFEAVVTSMAQWELRQLQKKMKKRGQRVKRDEEMVCYKDLGCFRDEGPFDYLDMLPSPPEEINTRFLLYTREKSDRERVIRYQNMSTILDSHFNTSRPTKMLIHGFGSSCYSVWIREMREALLMMMDVNIICVNWQKGAEVPNYVRAASNTRLVGRQVAVLIEKMNAFVNTTFDDFHLIGFSLGAHVSGHAGARLKNLSRISGLDPAGPLFESYSPSVRLDQTDAKFVDVIHTNADSLLMGGLGAFEPMGHVDFYPNGGRMQKGCANLFVGGVSDILWPTEGDGRYLCNHRRGYKYYLNSVAPICKFPSFVCRDYETFLEGNCFPCTACGNMGYFADKAEGRGQLYLVTRDTEPFCANQYKVSVKHSGGPPADPVTTYGRIEITFIASDGINETMQLTQSDDMSMEAGSESVRILVPHPALADVAGVQLRYTAYQGWIYSGFARWAIDKISLMDSFGKTMSFCNRGTTLVTGQAMQFTLLPGDCTVMEIPTIHSNNIHPFADSLPEESENEVRQTPPPQQIGVVAPPLETHLNLTKMTHGPINLTHPIPAPILTPVEGHSGVRASVPLSITLETPPQQSQDHPPIIYNKSRPQRLPPLQSVGHRPPNNPHPFRYGSDLHKAVTPSSTVLESVDADFTVSSEEPVSVIPAPNLAGLPRPFSVSHLQMPGHKYRPDALRSPEAVTSTPFIDNTSSLSTNPRTTSTVSHTASSILPQGNHQQAIITTRAEFVNATTIRLTTVREDATEKNTFDNTFSPRTNGIIPRDQTSGYSSTTPLTFDENLAGSVRPGLVLAVTNKSNSSTTPTSLRPPLDPTVTSGMGVTQQYVYLNRPREDFNPFLLERHLFRPPPPTLRPLHTQTELDQAIPHIFDSNSLIDGEINVKDRARALTLGPIPANSLKPPPSTGNKTKTNCSNLSSCSTHTTFNLSDRLPVVKASNTMSTAAAHSSLPSFTFNSRLPLPVQVHNLRRGNPQRNFPSAVDAPPQPRSSYANAFLEDSEVASSEVSIRPDAKSNPWDFSLDVETHHRPHNSQSLPVRISFNHSPSGEPSIRDRFLSEAMNPPLLPPSKLNPPPLETIVGYGRAPQPVTSHQESWIHNHSQNHHLKPSDHQAIHHSNRNNSQENGQVSFIAVQPQPVSHQFQPYQIQSAQSSQNQEGAHRQSVSFSTGNVTRMNVESSSSESPSLSSSTPGSVPFYVQILPPAFSQFPHLETYSIPRDARKAQDSSHRKRGGVPTRISRGRSLPNSPVPVPSSRGAVFKPLLLQLQDNRRGRYIPLRPPPEVSHIS